MDKIPKKNKMINYKIKTLREKFKKHSIDGYIVPKNDEFFSEYAFKDRLKVISKWGSGLDSIDKEAAKKFKIPVLNSPGAFSDAVGEVALGYLINLSRNISLTDKLVRQGKWPKISSSGIIKKKYWFIGLWSDR